MKIIRGKGRGKVGIQANNFINTRLKEKGIIKKMYQISHTSVAGGIWKKIMSANMPIGLTLADIGGYGGEGIAIVGKDKDIQKFKENLKKKEVLVRGSALILKYDYYRF